MEGAEEKHHHHHHHHHHHGHDFAAANAEHFSKEANNYRSELSIEWAKRGSAAIRSKFHFDPEKSEVLDFGTGPGLIAVQLLPDVKTIVGADSAKGMVEVFNKMVEEENFPKDKIRCVHLNKLTDDDSPLRGMTFDAILCVLTYHHFEDPVQTTVELCQHLKPNGQLLIIDFVDDQGLESLFVHKKHHHIVAHKHGFSNQQITEILSSAGLKDIQIDKAFEMKKSEMKQFQGHERFAEAMENPEDFTVHLFIASATKI